jgi:hypothetical protein
MGDTEREVYDLVWGEPGSKSNPDLFTVAMREALVRCACDTCHECGEHNATIRFFAECVDVFLKYESDCARLEVVRDAD